MRERLCIRCKTEQCATGSHFCRDCLDKKRLELEEQRKTQKKCIKCGEWKDNSLTYFGPGHFNKYGEQELLAHCRPCENERGRNKYQKYIKKERLRSRKKWLKTRIRALSYYSEGVPKCSCCNEEYIYFLQLDHINGDGANHRRSLGNQKGLGFYLWIIRNGFPDGYQVLCANCHAAKTALGRCSQHD